MSSFFKQLYRYTHPRSYRHNESLWPHVKISRAESGEIASLCYKKESIPIIPLSVFRGTCTGDALLVATGPSVSKLCFDSIPDMPAIGVNGAYFLNEKVDFRFYLIVDMGFIDNRDDIVFDIISDNGLILFTTMHGVAKIIDRFSMSAVRCQFSIVEDATCKIYHSKIERQYLYEYYGEHDGVAFFEHNKSVAFSKDIRLGVFDAETVVYWALQVIAYLGFECLYIAGLDMSNFHMPRFYETDNDKQPTTLPDKVSSVVIPAFRHASNIMKSKNITVKNLSLESAIDNDIFEKVDSDVVFKAS